MAITSAPRGWNRQRLYMSAFVVLLCVSACVNTWISREYALTMKGGDATGMAVEEQLEIETISRPREYLLSIPFYVYEDLIMVDDGTVSNQTHTISIHEAIGTNFLMGSPKHSDDYHFIMAALRHPMRVRDPAFAKLFVVPILSNLIIPTTIYPASKNKVCWKGLCGRSIMEHVDQTLKNSTWFQRNKGNDHIATVGFFGWYHPQFQGKDFGKIKLCHVLGFPEDRKINRRIRLNFPTMYVGTQCPLSAEKLYDAAFIGITSTKIREFKPRRDLCKWMRTNATNYTMPVCGRGKQCPTLAQSRFGFHVRGDSLGANRLQDTLLSGTVPIFTMKGQYATVPSWFDWDKLSYFADIANETIFMSSIKQIMGDKEGYQLRHQNVLSNRELFDWVGGYPFDTYMYMLQAHVFPNQRVNHTRYTALKLP